MEIWNLHKFNRLSSSGSFLPSFRCRPHIMMSGTEISHQYIATYFEQKRQSNQYIFFQSQSTGNTKRNEPSSHSSIQDDEYNNVWKSKQISSYWLLPLSWYRGKFIAEMVIYRWRKRSGKTHFQFQRRKFLFIVIESERGGWKELPPLKDRWFECLLFSAP